MSANPVRVSKRPVYVRCNDYTNTFLPYLSSKHLKHLKLQFMGMTDEGVHLKLVSDSIPDINGRQVFVSPKAVQFKKNERKYMKCERQSDSIIPVPRKFPLVFVRDHIPIIEIVPLRFGTGLFHGDFKNVLQSEYHRRISLCAFNDNAEQFEYHGCNPGKPMGAGGGNACSRPFQHLCHAIGIPTGPFHSLDQKWPIRLANSTERQYLTAKTIINVAFHRMMELLLMHPEKTVVYYSAEYENDNIGLGIFAGSVGIDVVEWITKKLKNLPKDFQKFWIKHYQKHGTIPQAPPKNHEDNYKMVMEARYTPIPDNSCPVQYSF